MRASSPTTSLVTLIGVLSLFVLVLGACSASPSDTAPTSSENYTDSLPELPDGEALNVKVVRSYPFDSDSFVQGLEMEEDSSGSPTLIVSTGLRGSSSIYRRTLDGQIMEKISLDPQYFGEGFTRVGDTLWQITWTSGTAFLRDAHTFAEKDSTQYSGEGWGLCHFDDALYLSDGTPELRVLDPATFAERSRISVTLHGSPLSNINELECVTSPDGSRNIYANIFLSKTIVRIDASTGRVASVIDASALDSQGAESLDRNNVLNGIAHIPGTDHYLLTGKRWPVMYEVEFVS